MDEKCEAAILQNFIQFQATKHGDHILKALPGMASRQTAKPTILVKKEEVVDSEYMEGVDPLLVDPLAHSDDNSNPSLDSGIGSPDQFYLQEQIQRLKRLQQLKQLQQIHSLNQPLNNRSALDLSKTGEVEPRPEYFSNSVPVITSLVPKVTNSISEVQGVVVGTKRVKLSSSAAYSMEDKNSSATASKRMKVGVTSSENCSIIKMIKEKEIKKESETRKTDEKVINKKRTQNDEPIDLEPKSQDGHPLCAVCGEIAGKHSYYGGQVCASCRAFFRRAVQSGCNATFFCHNESCDITVYTRKSCQFCRYEKCLKSGMRPNWILSEEERVRRFHGRKKKNGGDPLSEVSTGQANDSSDDPGSPSSIMDQWGNRIDPMKQCPLSKPLTFEESRLVSKWGTDLIRSCTGRSNDLSTAVVTDLVRCVYQGTQMSGNTVLRVAEVVDKRVKQSFSVLEDFRDLTEWDQSCLLRHNIPLLHRLRQALSISNNKFNLSNLLIHMLGEHRVKLNGNLLPTDISHDRTDSARVEVYTRNMYRNIMFKERAHSQDCLQLVDKIDQILDVEDFTCMVLLVLIIVFTTDFTDVEDTNKVENTQLKYVCLLQRHLASSSASQPLDLAVNSNQPLDLAVKKSQAKSPSSLVDLLMLPALLRQIHEISPEQIYF